MTYPPLTRGQLQILRIALKHVTISTNKYNALAARLGITRKELNYHLKVHGLYRSDSTCEKAVPLDSYPTTEHPGSEGKIAVLKDRAERGVALFHPDDEKVIARIGKTWQANLGERHSHRSVS